MGQILGVYRVTTDPSTGGGFAAAVGSIAAIDGTGKIFRKFGAGNTDWMLIASTLPTLNFIFFQSANAFLDRNVIAYDVMAQILYEGSTAVGTITKIQLIASSNNAGQSCGFRIFDATNALTIAENAAITSLGFTIIDLGVITAVPAGAAILEIQGKENNAAAAARVAAMIITLGA